MPFDEVRVAYTKYDGSLHWHQSMHLLGEDEHGVWLGAPAGVVARRGHDGPVVVTEQAKVTLFPPDTWWTADFNDGPTDVEIYCDIATPPIWPHSGEVTMADLDLDVIRERGSGAVQLVDEDEFAEHQLRYAYPPEVIERAEAASRWLMAAVQARSGPFGGAHLRWRSRLSQLRLSR